MSAPGDKKSQSQTIELNNPLPAEVLQDSVGEETGLESIKSINVPQANTEEEKSRVEKDIDRLYRSYEFHLDFALKAVGFFYAILGGILSIYFSGNGKISREVVIVLLGLPILMSIILGSLFLYGGWIWHEGVKLIREKTKINTSKMPLINKR